MRVTGAMRMARAGLPEGLIRTFGRWISSAVQRYIREAYIDNLRIGVATQVTDAEAAHRFNTGKPQDFVEAANLGLGPLSAIVHKHSRVRHMVAPNGLVLCGASVDWSHYTTCPCDLRYGRWHRRCLEVAR